MNSNKIYGLGLTGLAIGAFYLNRNRSTLCQAPVVAPRKNSAFVFIKPHANNNETQHQVYRQLLAKGLRVTAEGEFTGEVIDRDMLIDQHYYAIASKATLLKPEEIPVPKEKFLKAFGLTWEEALAQGVVYNAIEACKYLEVDADGIDALWAKAKKEKFGGGFYCGKIEVEGKKAIYVFNAFFMSMRSKFVTPGTSIHYYVVDFKPEELAWSDFRGKVLGPTDPHTAPVGSLREVLTTNWKSLGLGYEPTVGDNCVHASASPFEGLAERMNWLKVKPEEDAFGARVIAAGIPVKTIIEWSVDPQVAGKSIFDQLEDKDADECIAIMKKLSDATAKK